MTKRRALIADMLITMVLALGLIGLFAQALRFVLDGRGAETYQDVYGFPVSYTEGVITFGAIVLALAIALFFRLRDYLSLRVLTAEIDRKVDENSGKR
jgi:hypothetical protein